MDMVAMHASGMSVFVLGFGWCDINETIAVAGESIYPADATAAMHSAYEV